MACFFPHSTHGAKAVGIWLLLIALLIAAMVTVGGLTRLTGSGLSITEWHPVTGVVPPLSAHSWAEEFAKYQRIPQYRLENPHMSLADFRQIYLVGMDAPFARAVTGCGILRAFFVGSPARAQSAKRLAADAGVVRAGRAARLRRLVDGGERAGDARIGQPVPARHPSGRRDHSARSPSCGSRLTICAHLIPPPRRRCRAPRGAKVAAWALAFVALGLCADALGRAGGGPPCGPHLQHLADMDGRSFPGRAVFRQTLVDQFFENPGLAQFDHRIGAYLVALSALALWVAAQACGTWRDYARQQRHADCRMTGLQIVLGIITLLSQAPVALAALHQVTAVALLRRRRLACLCAEARSANVPYAAASA